MDVHKLYFFALTLIFVGLVVGTGVLIMDTFANQVRENPTVLDENVTLTQSGSQSTGTLTFSDTDVLIAANNETGGDVIAGGTDINVTSAGVVTFNGVFNGTFLIDYSYKYDSQTTTVLQSGRDAVGSISSTWLSLIVTIGALSIVLGLVIAGFAAYGGSRKR